MPAAAAPITWLPLAPDLPPALQPSSTATTTAPLAARQGRRRASKAPVWRAAAAAPLAPAAPRCLPPGHPYCSHLARAHGCLPVCLRACCRGGEACHQAGRGERGHQGHAGPPGPRRLGWVELAGAGVSASVVWCRVRRAPWQRTEGCCLAAAPALRACTPHSASAHHILPPPPSARPPAVAICLFSDSAATPKKLGRWGTADAAGIAAGIDALHTVGGTNFQVGLLWGVRWTSWRVGRRLPRPSPPCTHPARPARRRLPPPLAGGAGRGHQGAARLRPRPGRL